MLLRSFALVVTALSLASVAHADLLNQTSTDGSTVLFGDESPVTAAANDLLAFYEIAAYSLAGEPIPVSEPLTVQFETRVGRTSFLGTAVFPPQSVEHATLKAGAFRVTSEDGSQVCAGDAELRYTEFPNRSITRLRLIYRSAAPGMRCFVNGAVDKVFVGGQ